MNRIDEEYLRAFNALEACYRAASTAELGDLLGNMDINLSDGEPMDPLMMDYWHEAKSVTHGFEATIKFLEIWVSKYRQCPPGLRMLIKDLGDTSSGIRRDALTAWNAPVVWPEIQGMD